MKISLENKEIEESLRLFWRKNTAKWLLLSVPILSVAWFYLKEIAIPLLQIDNIKQTLENAKKLEELEVEKEKLLAIKEEYSQSLKDLTAKKDTLEEQSASLESEKAGLKDAYENLAADFEKLSRDSRLTEQERDAFKSKYESVIAADYDGAIRKLTEENQRLEAQLTDLKKRAAVYEDKSITDASTPRDTLLIRDFQAECEQAGGNLLQVSPVDERCLIASRAYTYEQFRASPFFRRGWSK